MIPSAIVGAAVLATPALANEALLWSVQVERLEHRSGDLDALAWEVDAFAGSDELKLRYVGEGEYELEERALESFENTLFLQVPISDFFDAKAGLRFDAPEGGDRFYGVVGVQGLAPQWFEVDFDLSLSEDGDPSALLDAEYEALITNRLILTPSIEVNLPFTDDRVVGAGAWGPTVEIGARLSYDLIDRMVSPYIGVHYERVFGETADLARAAGEDDEALYLVVGTRLQF
jgi:copper resistance protein B